MAQRLKAAGPWRIVFEQKPIVRQFVEKPFRDGVIGSFTVPHAALVAATEVNTERHTLETAHDGGFREDGPRQIGCGIFSARPHGGKRRFVRVRGKSGRVDVHVTTTGLDQLLYHTPLDIDDIRGEQIRIGVNRPRCLVVESLNYPVRSDKAHFHGPAGDGAGAFVLGKRNVIYKLQPLFGRPSMRYRRAGLSEVGYVPSP